jgi:hypothetical protein
MECFDKFDNSFEIDNKIRLEANKKEIIDTKCANWILELFEKERI